MNTTEQWSEKLCAARAALIDREYLASLTSFERVHVLAERAKHKPVFIDSDKLRRRDFERMSYTLPTRDGVLWVSTVKRPTEAAAELAIMRGRVELPPVRVVLIRKDVAVRWCERCKDKRPAAQFPKNRARLHGYRYVCAACRDELRRAVWRRAG